MTPEDLARLLDTLKRVLRAPESITPASSRKDLKVLEESALAGLPAEIRREMEAFSREIRRGDTPQWPRIWALHIAFLLRRAYPIVAGTASPSVETPLAARLVLGPGTDHNAETPRGTEADDRDESNASVPPSLQKFLPQPPAEKISDPLMVAHVPLAMKARLPVSDPPAGRSREERFAGAGVEDDDEGAGDVTCPPRTPSIRRAWSSLTRRSDSGSSLSRRIPSSSAVT